MMHMAFVILGFDIGVGPTNPLDIKPILMAIKLRKFSAPEFPRIQKMHPRNFSYLILGIKALKFL